MSTLDFSLIVPCYNEQDMLPLFLQEAVPQLDTQIGRSWEIIVVDDGSQDNTAAIVALHNAKDPRIKGVFLSRNFGHQAAVNAGLAYAIGDAVGVIDCDLQDPIAVLIEMYNACSQGVEVCYGIRQKRDAPALLRFFYSLFYWLMSNTSNHAWPRDAGDFCVMSRRALNAILLLPERSRMLRGLRSWVGFPQKGFPYARPRRLSGRSKYNIRKLVDLALLGFVGFSDAPLRLIGVFGFAVGLVALLIMLSVVINRLFPHFTLLGYWVGSSPMAATILVVFLFFMGLLFIFLGILGEYIRVVLHEVKGRPVALVTTTVGSLPASNSTSVVSPTEVSNCPCEK
ncbi:glycosyltransferase family 2 protein [Fundidesulfovibrio soli]|uniref:glycosyltransferase family 2 protein n=1 Tax=Fundidesulfovibrio soli TaxID=2922716 RepID=UPI001FAF162C|nr:glycosyltransferase family 2 protein [Fundidesulfovibrio soli]